MTKRDFAWLQKNIGYTFNDESIRARAFIHSSADMGESYERLEFLGDAVLELTISELIFLRRPDFSEGELTKSRAALVNERALVKVADDLELGEFIVLGRGEQNSGGAQKPSILADIVEALIGAVYIDGGFDSAKALVIRMLEDSVEKVLSGGGVIDYKTRLQEHFHKKGVNNLNYEVYKEQGPPHNKEFYVKLIVGTDVLSQGKGRSKNSAEQRAAKEAFLSELGEHEE